MIHLFKNIVHILSETFRQFLDDNGLKLSASLSYYTLFAIAPLLVLIISIGGLIFGGHALRGELGQQIEGVVGYNVAQFIQATISNIEIHQQGKLGAILGAGVLIISASSIFIEIQSSIHILWKIKTKDNKGLLNFIMGRLLSLLTIIILGLMVSVATLLAFMIKFLSNNLPEFAFIPQLDLIYFFNELVLFFAFCIFFLILLKLLPNAFIRFKDAVVGALFTTLLFMAGKILIAHYLSVANIVNIYGAAASVALLMVWVYYSAIILYFGVTFTKIYIENKGNQIRPNRLSMKYNR